MALGHIWQMSVLECMASVLNRTWACSSSLAVQHLGACDLLVDVGALERTCAQAQDDALDPTLMAIFLVFFQTPYFLLKMHNFPLTTYKTIKYQN